MIMVDKVVNKTITNLHISYEEPDILCDNIHILCAHVVTRSNNVS
jgi:hypothetical protein